MVERGIIKTYFGSKSYNKGRYGFIKVIGEDNKPTGEEVYFHLNHARQTNITYGSSEGDYIVTFSDIRADAVSLEGEPLKGDYVVFTAEAGKPNRKVIAWTLASIWDDELFWLEHQRTEAEEAEDERRQAGEEECPGICGQTVSTCTCIELASFRSHNSMTDGYWTA